MILNNFLKAFYRTEVLLSSIQAQKIGFFCFLWIVPDFPSSNISLRMSVEEEVLNIRKQIEKMTEPGQDQSQALDILKALSEINMTLTILTTTRIGMAVNAFR